MVNARDMATPLRFVEYDEVRQLLQEMAYTISDQVRALYQQNEQLQRANSEKEAFNQRLLGFNDELEQEVASQTTALRSALSREERSRHILQSWLQFGLHQQLDIDIAELASSALLQSVITRAKPGWLHPVRSLISAPYCACAWKPSEPKQKSEHSHTTKE